MVDTLDLVKSVYETLGETFPNVPLWDKDLDKIKDTEKPCYVVDVDDMSEYLFNGSYIGNNATVTIFYFGDTRVSGWANLLKQKKELFKMLSVPHDIDGLKWMATNVDFAIDKDDMVLSAIFDITLIQDATYEREASLEPMEELEYDEEEL